MIVRKGLFKWWAEVPLYRIDHSKKPPVRTQEIVFQQCLGPFYFKRNAQQASDTLERTQRLYEVRYLGMTL
jgi:hypothetical protein